MLEKIYQFFIKKPEISFCLSFLVLILIGTFFLILPFSTHENISFINALFTAVSAVCVTGLIVVDTGTAFTTFGQIVILFLIQLGALGIMVGASFVFLLAKRGLAILFQAGAKEELGINFVVEARKTIKFIILSTFSLQILATIFLFFSWQDYFQNIGKNLFYSFFHSVSAFGNAGFSLFSDNLEGFRNSISINIIFSFLIILGGLGFIVLMEFWQYFLVWCKRRKKRKISLHSKLILVVSFFLIFLGAFLFYFFERENLSHLSSNEVILVSFFQSVTARTAGFNTIDMGNLENPTYLLYIFLMFVGGAPASTAGGIKVITLFLILFSIYSFFQKKANLTIFKKTIPSLIIKRSFIIFNIFLLIAIVFSLILLYTEEAEFKDILFEVFSALGTVGLSTGLTSELSFLGKLSIIFLMFVGRVGPLVLVIISSKQIVEPKIHYSEERIILG